MKKSLLFTAFVLFSVTSFAQTWVVDKAHAQLGFAVTHMMLAEVDGNFKTFDAKITTTKPDFSDATVELTADVNSFDTDNERRDGDLKSDKWFNAAQYPTLTFKSTSFTKVEGKKYKLAGNLTMHGVTKPVTLDVTMTGPVTMDSPRGKQEKLGMKVTGIVKRSDFNIGSAPAAVVSEEVEIRANGEFAKQDSASEAKK